MKTKMITWLFGIIFLAAILIFLFIYSSIPDVKPIYKVIKINSNDKNDSVFIKRKVWGMTSDYSNI